MDWQVFLEVTVSRVTKVMMASKDLKDWVETKDQ